MGLFSKDSADELLIKAAKKGNLDGLKQALAQGAKVNCTKNGLFCKEIPDLECITLKQKLFRHAKHFQIMR